jgi:hypothetical protein
MNNIAICEGESKSDVLQKARTDVGDAEVLLLTLSKRLEPQCEGDISSLVNMAIEKVSNAYVRVDACQKELVSGGAS